MSMNENELERFEAQLRTVNPARPPAEFIQRLMSETAGLVAERRAQTALAVLAEQSKATAAPETFRADPVIFTISPRAKICTPIASRIIRR